MLETASLPNQTTTSHSAFLQPVPTALSIVSLAVSQTLLDTCRWFSYTDVEDHRGQAETGSTVF